MDSGTYEVEALAEENHWWFVGRRKLFRREISRFGLDLDARILDTGTSTGTNLRMLGELGYRNVTGVDSSPEAIRHCADKGLGDVHLGDVCNLPFADDDFDLVMATDIIEHVDDDGRAIEEIKRVLRPGGHLLLTVPAFPSLWGLQDDVSHHKRRYRRTGLLNLLRGSRLQLLRHYYFNFFLFLPIFLARRLIAVLGIKLRSEGQINTPLLNRLLGTVFFADVALAPRLHIPFGVSLLVICRRAASDMTGR